MGRRPNPLMAEFFQRGAKMQDQSNRYEQTCKRCNHLFDKGRYESMVPHLTKGCPNISYAERAKIIFRLHDLAVPNVHPYIDPTFKPDDESEEVGADDNGQAKTNRCLIESGDNNQVQLEFPPGRFETDGPSQSQDGLNVLAEASQRAGNANGTVSYALSDGLGNDPLDPQLDLSGHLVANPVSSEVGYADHVAGLALFTAGGLEPSVAVPTHVQMLDELSGDNLQEPQPQGIDKTPGRQLRPIAIQPETRSVLSFAEADTFAPVTQRQQRIRGRFAPDRRDDVRRMREKRACVRCRMLRKPCSTDTPCLTCASVEVPRLWTLGCVRTKLEDAISFYSTMPYSADAHKKLEEMKEQATSNTVTGSLEVHHFLGHKLIFKARQFTNVYMSINNDHQPSFEDQVITMDFETDNVPPKVEKYLQAISGLIIDKEPSPAIRVSLQFAMKKKEEVARSNLNEQPDKPDNLISNVIELWVATVVITDRKLKALFTEDNVLGGGRSPVDANSHPVSHGILEAQLRAAAEKRANVVARDVMRSFEQRILRNKCKNYETSLIAFIMLNCAERMCWLYKFWGIPGARFPLDGDPLRYAAHAESFADLVQDLLRFRHSQPKITKVPQTGIWTARDHNDTALNNWLMAVGFTDNLPEHFGPGLFSPDDSRSLDGTFSARLFKLEPAA